MSSMRSFLGKMIQYDIVKYYRWFFPRCQERSVCPHPPPFFRAGGKALSRIRNEEFSALGRFQICRRGGPAWPPSGVWSRHRIRPGKLATRRAGALPRRGGHRGRSPLYRKWVAGGFRYFCLRASDFLPAKEVTKDALRGARARWVSRLRFAAAVAHRPRPLRDLPHLRGLTPDPRQSRPAPELSRPCPSCSGRYGLGRQTKTRLRWPGGACVPELTAWAVIGA